jgi:predicted nucleic-acid-binding protein
MIGVDSNVLVRLITRDDPGQTAAAERLVAGAPDDSIHINLVVLAELAWVLRESYGYEPAAVLGSIEKILQARQFRVERPELAASAVAEARRVGCGFADAVIVQVDLAAGATRTMTFDSRARRLAGMELLK